MSKKIDLIIIDQDGVLTDGRLTIDYRGEKMFKSYHTRDVRAIRELVSRGNEVVIVTADDWEGVRCFAEKVGAVVEVERDKSIIAEKYAHRHYVMVGDDAWDIPLLRNAAAAFCPKDAMMVAKHCSHAVVLNRNGGTGVVAEVLERLIDRNLI